MNAKRVKIAMTSANNGTQHEMTILDLNDDCLEAICQHLNEYQLYNVRDAHVRFAYATERCYSRIESTRALDFNFKYWSEDNHIDDLVKILQYFGHCMTRVRINEWFIQFIREKSVPQSFLCERLQNVRHLSVHRVDHDGIEFISKLDHIQEISITHCDVGMLLEKMYNFLEFHLCNETLGCDSKAYSYVNPKCIEKIIAFLLAHRRIQKLSIDTYFITHRITLEDEEKLLEAIANNMTDLIELHLHSARPNKNSKLMSALHKLQKLTISDLPAIESFRTLKHLKSLSVASYTCSIDELYNIVETIPTLIYLEINYDPESLDNVALEKLIQKRKLSPYCESELLRIDRPASKIDFCFHNHRKRNEEYVSCEIKRRETDRYDLILDDPNGLLFGIGLIDDFDQMPEDYEHFNI